MKYHIVCPYCEYKLFMMDGKAVIEIVCPKCKSRLIVESKENKVFIDKTGSEKTTD